MATGTALTLAALRFALFVGCRLTLLPWLFGEAKYASLDTSAASGSRRGSSIITTTTSAASLPSPAVAATTSRRATAVTRAWQIMLGLSPASLLLSLSFEEGVTPFLLVLAEAMGFEQHTLRVQWTGSLYGIVALAVVLVPMGLCVFLTYTLFPQGGPTALPRRLLSSLVPFAVWLLVFVKVPLPSTLSKSAGLLDSALTRAAVIGVALIAVLSGSGAMGAAMDSYAAWSTSRSGLRRDPTPSDVRSAEASFQRACQDLERTKSEIQRIKDAPDTDGAQGGWFAGLDRVVRGSSKHRGERKGECCLVYAPRTQLKALDLEVTSLSMLAASMRDELDQLKARRQTAEWNATVSGRIWLAIGHAFAAYCVLRMVVSLLSILFFNYSTAASSSSPDLISTLLARLLRVFGIDIDVATWSKQISLLLVGVLIVARLRVVLNYIARFFRAASSGASTSFLLLFLSQVLVIYLLATLIQLRASLPPSFGSGSSEADSHQPAGSRDSLPGQQRPLLASLPDFNIVFGFLFDAAFLLSAAITGAVGYFASRQESILFDGARG
ncbi:unnamed protein product [Parajaminaea phylloscopi]